MLNLYNDAINQINIKQYLHLRNLVLMEATTQITCPSSRFSMQNYVIGGIILSIICPVGIFCNAMAVLILIGRYLRKTLFARYLRMLCVSDTIVLISSLFMIVLPNVVESFNCKSDVTALVNRMIVIFYPIGMIGQSASTWLATVTSMVRYISIRFPLRSRWLQKTDVIKSIVISIWIAAFLFNIPRLLELTLVVCFDKQSNQTTAYVDPTTLRHQPLYKLVYLGILYTLCMFFLPFTLMLTFSIAMSRMLIKAHSQHLLLITPRKHSQNPSFHVEAKENIPTEITNDCSVKKQEMEKFLQKKTMPLPKKQIITMTTTTTTDSTSITNKNNHTITILLLAVVISFLVCESLPLAANVLEILIEQISIKNDRLQQAYSYCTGIGNVTVCLRASLNFFIYLLFSRRFRTGFAWRHRSQTSSTTTVAAQPAAQSQKANSQILTTLPQLHDNSVIEINEHKEWETAIEDVHKLLLCYGIVPIKADITNPRENT